MYVRTYVCMYVYIYGHPHQNPPHAVCTDLQYNIKHVFFMFRFSGLLTYIYLSKH